MSLAVMAVRLAIKAALAPFVPEGEEPAWPTLAGDRVFDSRFDLIDGRGGERTPLIVFAVEAFEGNAFSDQDGAGIGQRGFDAVARLVISAQVTSRQTFVDDETGQDFEAEAADLLDHELADRLAILQEQVWIVLQQDPAFKKVVRRIRKLDAEPYPATETGDKLAVLANSYYLEPLSDGEAALAIVQGYQADAAPVNVRAALALGHVAATRAVLLVAARRRTGQSAPVPFSVDGIAQGAPFPSAPSIPPAPSAPDVHITLDPEDPIS